MTILPPMWIYECSSGPAENEGRYQTGILKRGWAVLTPSICQFANWMETTEGDGCTFAFHLPETKISRGTMDLDAGLIARAGERGMVARARAMAFPKYLAHVLRTYPRGWANVYLGSILCDSLETLLDVRGRRAWFDRIRECLAPYLDMARQTGRLDLSLDMSSGLDTRDHEGLIVLAWLESELARYDCKLYVEGVPSPQSHQLSDRAEMFGRNWIAREDNWTKAVTDNPARTIDPSLLTGEGVRWPAGWKNDPTKQQRNNAFEDDPMRLFTDVVQRGHRFACDANWLINTLGAKNWTEYQAMAGKVLQ